VTKNHHLLVATLLTIRGCASSSRSIVIIRAPSAWSTLAVRHGAADHLALTCILGKLSFSWSLWTNQEPRGERYPLVVLKCFSLGQDCATLAAPERYLTPRKDREDREEGIDGFRVLSL
jgi:hypothetical protein